MIDTTPIIAAMACGATAVVFFSAGTVFGTSWASRGRDEYVIRLKRKIAVAEAQENAWRNDCFDANGKLLDANLHIVKVERRVDQLKVVNKALSDELTGHLASRARSNANLIKANEARKAKRLDKQAKERLISQATHASMREKLERV